MYSNCELLILRAALEYGRGLRLSQPKALNQTKTSENGRIAIHLSRFSSVFQRLIKKNQNAFD